MSDIDSDSSSGPCNRQRSTRADRKAPRLCLDDALIMVGMVRLYET